MQNLIKDVKEVREKLKEYGEWLEEFDKEIPNAFNMVFKALTLTLELLHYYHYIWSYYDTSGLSPEEIERLRRENAERIIEITKWAFIHAMSIIEFSLKSGLRNVNPRLLDEIVRRKQGRAGRGRRVFIYLSNIVKGLRVKGCISDEDYNVWRALIEVRNTVVHNNVIADKDKVLHVGDIEIRFIKGRMLKGRLNFFVDLIKYAIEAYRHAVKVLRTCGTT